MKKTIEEIRQEVSKINEKFTIPDQEYKNVQTKIKVICKEHGEFYQYVTGLIRGRRGCAACSGNKKKTYHEFVKQAKEVHGDTYEYPIEQYFKNNDTKVKIICKVHGEFLQTPHDHLSKKGCIKCSGRYRPTFQEFIIKANTVHNNRYEYPDQEYKNNRNSLKIICKTHGEFLQTPHSHLSGKGCWQCSRELQYIGYNEKNYFDPFIREYFNNKHIITQYPVYKKRKYEAPFLVDFAIPELGIIIEYDEYHHKFIYKRDKEREDYIVKTTGYKMIRIDDKRFMKEGKTYFESIINNI
jgi:very-short-patch-repair endonuclease